MNRYPPPVYRAVIEKREDHARLLCEHCRSHTPHSYAPVLEQHWQSYLDSGDEHYAGPRAAKAWALACAVQHLATDWNDWHSGAWTTVAQAGDADTGQIMILVAEREDDLVRNPDYRYVLPSAIKAWLDAPAWSDIVLELPHPWPQRGPEGARPEIPTHCVQDPCRSATATATVQ